MSQHFKTDKEVKEFIEKVKQKIKDKNREARFLAEQGFTIMSRKVETR